MNEKYPEIKLIGLTKLGDFLPIFDYRENTHGHFEWCCFDPLYCDGCRDVLYVRSNAFVKFYSVTETEDVELW